MSKKTNTDFPGEKNPVWKFPWKYKESFFISIELLIISFAIEIFTRGREIKSLHWPLNLIIGFGFILLLLVIYTFYKKHPLIKWIASIPAAVSSITLYTLLVLLMGFLPQNNPEAPSLIKYLGLSHIKTSWPMLISQLYFLTTLGFVTIRRATPLTRKNIGFLLNHAGLWITITFATLGSGDLKRWYINIYEDGGFIPHAYDDQKKVHVLPFSVKLINFDIDEYNPKIGIANRETGQFLINEEINLYSAEEDLHIIYSQWEIKVEKILPSARKGMGKYFHSDEPGSAPAALISLSDNLTGKSDTAWISSGGYYMAPEYLTLDDKYLLALLKPEAKIFSSFVEIKSEEEIIDTLTIEVNKPHKVKGWKLYQLNYNQDMGKWSNLSVLEIVKDPWLPVVYLGIIMLLAGAFYIFWIGKDIKE